jgi:PAS domain S-box-containing protein
VEWAKVVRRSRLEMVPDAVRPRWSVADSITWQLALMRSRLSNLERKAEQPHADAGRLMAECVRELKNTFDFLDAAGDRLRDADAELKKVQASVRYEQERFNALLDLLSDAFLSTDLSGVIVEGNAAAGRLLNLSQRALVGRPLHVFLNGERVEFLKFLKELPEKPDTPERELQLRPRERHYVTTMARVGIVRNLEGRPSGLHWILRRVDSEQPPLPLVGSEARSSSCRSDDDHSSA